MGQNSNRRIYLDCETVHGLFQWLYVDCFTVSPAVQIENPQWHIGIMEWGLYKSSAKFESNKMITWTVSQWDCFTIWLCCVIYWSRWPRALNASLNSDHFLAFDLSNNFRAEIKLVWYIHYGTHQAWLTFSHVPLNSYHSLAPQWSSGFHAFADKPLIELS